MTAAVFLAAFALTLGLAAVAVALTPRPARTGGRQA